MERIFKFRVWDKILNKWGNPGDFLSIINDGILICETQNSIIQQFTGYKDKNDQPIFEGDIVKVDPNHITNVLKADKNPTYTKGQIMWLCSGFKVCQSGIGATWLGDFVACHCCSCGLEIIGNVLENSELLEETKI